MVIPGVIEPDEDPLGPFVVRGVGRVYLTVPVVAQSKFLYLAAEGVAVFICGDCRVGSGLDGVLFCRKAEGIPSHGVKNIEALHPLVAGNDVSGGVTLGMAYVETGTGGVGVHVEDIAFVWVG